ncbi:MAG: HD-GYP domain-containing protein [bacterium]
MADLVLVVDDEELNRKLLRELLTNRGYRVEEAATGEEAIAKVGHIQPDLVLLDIMMPGIDGLEACRVFKQTEATRLIPVVLLSALSALEDRVAGIEAGADDFLYKPFNSVELLARIRSLVRVKHLNDALERTEGILFALAETVEAKDSYTKGHLQRLVSYAAGIAAALGVPEHFRLVLRYSALLHDIGKIAIPDAILTKAEKLTPDEVAIMRQHTEIGQKIVRSLRFGDEIAPIVRSHHERWDGNGYPDGLAGDAIPLGARIVAAADAFDAMTTERPYSAGMSADQACETLRKGAGTQWDAAVVDAFFAYHAFELSQDADDEGQGVQIVTHFG